MSKPAWGVKPLDGAFEIVMRDWLQTMLANHPITRVVYEAPFIGPQTQGGTILKMAALPAIVHLVCHDFGIEYQSVSPPEWRKHFIGVTRAPKEIKSAYRRTQWLKDMTMRACAERGWHVTKDDAADACGILDWALATEFPAYRR